MTISASRLRGFFRCRWLGGMLRAALVLACLVGLAFFGWLRSAEAQVGESLRGFGSELMRWQSARLHTAPRRLRLNGLELRVVSLSSPGSVSEMLDRFHASCRAHGGLRLGEADRARLGIDTDGTFRQETDDEGVVACIDTGHPLSVADMMDRIRLFTETGDLSSVGGLRYAMARRDGRSTTAVALWTEGPAPLLASFPKGGDAPGIDPVDVPRMPGTRRLLSAAEEGLPYSLNIYSSDRQDAERTLAWYRASLTAGGWAIRPGADPHTLIAQRGDRGLLVRTKPGSSAGRALVTVAELS